MCFRLMQRAAAYRAAAHLFMVCLIGLLHDVLSAVDRDFTLFDCQVDSQLFTTLQLFVLRCKVSQREGFAA